MGKVFSNGLGDLGSIPENSFIPIYVWKYVFKVDFRENDDPQILQGNGFSSGCICIWLVKDRFSENAKPQTLEENGFSPECIQMCVFKLKFCENSDLYA